MDGAGRVVHSFLSQLPDYPEHDFIVLHLPEYTPTVRAKNITYKKMVFGITSLRNLFFGHRELNPLKIDVLYSPFMAAPLLHRYRVALVVHDLYFWDDSIFFNPRTRRLFHLIKLFTWWRLGAADAIITVSKTSERQVRSLPLMAGKKIFVVHNPLDPTLHLARRQPVGYVPQPEQYALYVGKNRNHKNLSMLIRAFARMAQQATLFRLVLAGWIDPRYPDPRHDIEAAGLGDSAIHVGPVSDEELAALYRDCAFVVFPSRYEGFGLPAIEAASFGKAVLCSDIEGLRETMGDAPMYVDPTDEAGWAEAMLRLFTDGSLRQAIAKACTRRAELFTVRNFADNLIVALEHTASGT